MFVAGFCGVRAVLFLVFIFFRSIIIMSIVYGLFWSNWEILSFWFLLIFSWRMVTIFWKLRGSKVFFFGKYIVFIFFLFLSLWFRGCFVFSAFGFVVEGFVVFFIFVVGEYFFYFNEKLRIFLELG